MLEKFGAKMAEERKRRGWTQAQLAKKMGVHGQFIVMLESGNKRPSVKTVAKAAEAFQLPAQYFFDFAQTP